MRSDIPHFQEPGSEDDDARWEAYQALLRRQAPPPDPEAEDAADEPRNFEPPEPDADITEPADALELNATEAFEEPLPNPFFHTQPPEAAFGPAAPAIEPRRRPSGPRRGLRLVAATAAVTAGIILAVALVPRQPAEPARIVAAPPTPAAASALPASPAETAKPPEKPAEPAPPATAAAAPLVAAAAVHVPEHRGHRHMDRARHLDEAALLRDLSQNSAAPTHNRAAPSRYGALSCWLTVMNNGKGAGYRDAGLSICQGAAAPPNATANLNARQQAGSEGVQPGRGRMPPD